MASSPPPPGPPPVAHRAPMPEMRPRSPIAFWALGSSIVLSVAAFLLLFLWIAMVPALVLATWAVVKIRPAEQRGQGMGIAAMLLSLLVGSCSFMISRTTHQDVEGVGESLLAALDSENPQKMTGAWIAPDARENGAVETIQKRFQAAKDALGPYERKVDSGSLLWGARPVLVPPLDVEEIGPPSKEDYRKQVATLWLTAYFERGSVKIELVPAGKDMTERAKSLEKLHDPSTAQPVLEDVRFFRAKRK